MYNWYWMQIEWEGILNEHLCEKKVNKQTEMEAHNKKHNIYLIKMYSK